MAAFVTALSVPWATQILPPIMYSAWRSERRPLQGWQRYCTGLVFAVGVLNFVVCAGAAVGKVALKELRGPTVIGCAGFVVFSDADKFRR